MAALTSNLRDATEESSRFKKRHNQLEKENASLQLSVKSLQQKQEDLQKRYTETMKEVKEARQVSSSTKEQVAIAGTGVLRERERIVRIVSV
jgi:predicted nuclease with TOPRIM domain